MKEIVFELPDNAALNLAPGRHLMLKAEIDGETVERKYTPTSLPETQGQVPLLPSTHFLVHSSFQGVRKGEDDPGKFSPMTP